MAADESTPMIRLPLLFLCLFSSVRGAAQPPGDTPSCHSVLFAAKLNAYDDFDQDLGDGLVLRVKSFNEPAWFIDVVPAAKPQNDYVYPVNPPLRFNGNQMLGPGYSETIESSLNHPHEMYFLLSAPDFDRISSLIGNVLWPYQTSDPDKALADYLAALKAAKTGWLELTVRHYEVDAAGGLKSIQFRVQVVVPSDFALDKDLKYERVSCPAKNNWP